ncbi:hypothetical protein, partial [Photobacterium sanctipauli]
MKLKRTLLSTAVLSVLLGLVGCNSDSNSETPFTSTPILEYVDTLIGTQGLGNVNPSPVMPEGMIQPSP